MPKELHLAAVALLIGVWAVSLAHLSAEDELEGKHAVLKAAEKLLPYFAKEPGQDWSQHFTSTFLKAVSAAQIDMPVIFRDYYLKHGRALSVRLLRMLKPYRAELEVVFEKQVIVVTLIEVEAQPPHRIISLFFRGAQPEHEDWEKLHRELQQLPGRVSLCCQRLEPTPTRVVEHQPDEILAVASAFKLVVLSALAEEVQAGRRRWKDVETIRRAWASLPAGLLYNWPDGAPVTLFTLAALMIGQSDNTAADHLIHLLGRDRIERQQQRLGVRHPHKNVPFLTTAELFKLKLVLDAREQDAFVRGSVEERRKLLETTLQSVSLERPRPLGEPQRIEEIEWFYSTADLCCILDGLRRQGQAVPEILDVLALNPGLPVNRGYWDYVGYKGGAEPGVLSYSLLLRSRSGQWFALAVVWNNPREAVESTRLHTLALRVLRYIEQTYPLKGN